MAQFFDNEKENERVVLVAVHERYEPDNRASLDELSELVKTAGAVSVGIMEQNLETLNPVTYLGKGKIEELKTMLVACNATGIVCDTELTPVQMKIFPSFWIPKLWTVLW